MIPDFGFASLVLAFAVSIYAVLASSYGQFFKKEAWVQSGRNAVILTFPLLLIACAMLVTAMLTGDFSVEYVWRVTSRNMPDYLKVTALWGGQAGSLLFWNLLLALFSALALLRSWDKDRQMLPFVVIMLAVTQIFFLLLSTFLENPFARLEFIPPDGNGLNPLLRHPGMIIHPPLLYLGFTGFTIPYAFAIAALISGKLDDGWIQATRRWTLIAWLFLSLGLILGGRWAYDVLGWGGYWAWDPVENASFMPWLSGTAFLHSVMIQEKRKMFKMWNMFLIILTYILILTGTFIVRTGVISSVHSFAESDIGPYFLYFWSGMLLFSFAWIFRRWDELASKNRVVSMLSREAAFLYNNFVILVILAIVFVFTKYPIISEFFVEEKLFLGPDVYETALAPLFLVLVLLMGVAPLTMWIRTSAERIGMAVRWPMVGALGFVLVLLAFGITNWAALLGFWVVMLAAILTVLEFTKGTKARMKRGESLATAFVNLMARNRRRYGGYWIHVGVIVMAFGIIGVELFQQETQIRVNRGESLQLGEYTATFQGIRRFPGEDDLMITEASVDVSLNGRYLTTLTPRTELYTRTNQPMTIPSARSTVWEDFYILMVSWESASNEAATFKAYINPLINWVWAGGFIFTFGTLIAIWPVAEPTPATARRRKPALGVGD